MGEICASTSAWLETFEIVDPFFGPLRRIVFHNETRYCTELGMKGILKADAVPSVDAANTREDSEIMTEREQRKVRVVLLAFIPSIDT